MKHSLFENGWTFYIFMKYNPFDVELFISNLNGNVITFIL